MPTAEIIKTETLPNGRRRHYILVDLAADHAADTTKPPSARLPSLEDGSP